MTAPQKGTQVPWQNQKQWAQVKASLAAVRSRPRGHIEEMRSLALETVDRLESLSRPMDDLCAVTCPSCGDICCTHATIWYDFKDLLTIYFSERPFPERQISRGTNGSCGCLSENGCTISRGQRPFVCTWYLCSAQQIQLQEFDADLKKQIENQIFQIKNSRRRLEALFMLSAVSPG